MKFNDNEKKFIEKEAAIDEKSNVDNESYIDKTNIDKEANINEKNNIGNESYIETGTNITTINNCDGTIY